MDSDAELIEIEYGYLKLDRRVLVRATKADVDRLVADVTQLGWLVRPHSVDVYGITDARDAVLADLEGR